MQKFKVLITGAGGFIGTALRQRHAAGAKVIALDFERKPENLPDGLVWEQADITDFTAVKDVLHRHIPGVVIHCAGIAHQKVGAVSAEDYMRVNSEATEKLAKVASAINPDVRFIFLSTVSVYGEEYLSMPVSEDSACHPSSDYAASKCDAERRLVELSERGILYNLIILRLAPVYDRSWSLNLDRRVFAPGKMTYLRFGSGKQQMSALARPNLVDFIEYLLKNLQDISGPEIINVSDRKPYAFNTIIRLYKNSGVHADRPIVTVPLQIVWAATRIAAGLMPNKKQWLHSAYDKLASSLVFDNNKMLRTGFIPRHSLESIFNPQLILDTTNEV